MQLTDFMSGAPDILSLPIEKNKLTIIAGSTNVGKSSFLTALLSRIVSTNNKAAVITLEETKDQFFSRIMSNLCNIKMRDIKNPTLQEKQKPIMLYVASQYKDKVFIEGQYESGMHEIKNKLQDLKNKGVDHVFIDNVGLIVNKAMDFHKSINQALSTLSRVAEDLELTIVATAALFRYGNMPPYLQSPKHFLYVMETADENLISLADRFENRYFFRSEIEYNRYTPEYTTSVSARRETKESIYKLYKDGDLLQSAVDYARMTHHKLKLSNETPDLHILDTSFWVYKNSKVICIVGKLPEAHFETILKRNPDHEIEIYLMYDDRLDFDPKSPKVKVIYKEDLLEKILNSEEGT